MAVREGTIDAKSDNWRAAAAELFVLCYPLMMANAVRRAHPLGFHQFHLATSPAEALAPGLAESDDDRVVLTSAWLDLSAGPVAMRFPHTHGRFFSLTLIDSAGEPFTHVGSRNFSDTGRELILVGPDWRGELPEGASARRAPSDGVWAVSRIYAHSTFDRAETLEVAQRQQLDVLGGERRRWPAPLPALEPLLTPSLRQVASIELADIFRNVDRWLERAPQTFRRAVEPTVKALKIILDGPPEAGAWTEPFARSMEMARKDALFAIATAADNPYREVGLGGWPNGEPHVERLPATLARAANAHATLGAPLAEDLITFVCDLDAEGRRLNGEAAYRLRFPPGALPPTRAFWRLSAGPAANHDQRRGVGCRDNLALARDGSLDIILRAWPDDLAHVSNWLPTPDGDFSLTMRLYWPSRAALRGGWRLPAVERLPSVRAARPEALTGASRPLSEADRLGHSRWRRMP